MSRRLKIGDRVRVVDALSAFNDRKGTVDEMRPGLLPYGVRLIGPRPRRSVVWFDAKELRVRP